CYRYRGLPMIPRFAHSDSRAGGGCLVCRSGFSARPTDPAPPTRLGMREESPPWGHTPFRREGPPPPASPPARGARSSHTTPALAREVFGLAEGLSGELRLDFGTVAFLTSAGLEMLLTLRQRLQARGGRLQLCNVTPHVAEVFAVTRLERLFGLRVCSCYLGGKFFRPA